jgi:hypothetical protein
LLLSPVPVPFPNFLFFFPSLPRSHFPLVLLFYFSYLHVYFRPYIISVFSSGQFRFCFASKSKILASHFATANPRSTAHHQCLPTTEPFIIHPFCRTRQGSYLSGPLKSQLDDFDFLSIALANYGRNSSWKTCCTLFPTI